MSAADRARARLVDDLRLAGRVPSPAVEAAFRAVPRHLFLPGLSPAEAYADEAVAVQHVDGVATSSASQPSMMAIMLEQLGLRPGLRVLEIGAGTGYNAALMARIVGTDGAVTSVDIDEDLVATAQAHLAALRDTGVELPPIALHCGDGAMGHPPGAPYDRIVLTVGSSDVRPEWVAQLAPGGRLLLPLAVRGSQLSVALDLGADGLLRSASVRSCSFIRLRGIGGNPGRTVGLGPGLSLAVPDDAAPVDPAAVAAALAVPGPAFAAPAPLGPADVWDGFGLWLALTGDGVFRLLADATHPLAPDGLPVATVGLAAAGGTGIAVLRPGRTGTGAVLTFGAGGPAAAQRLLAAMGVWLDAGRPGAAQWEVVVVPAGSAVTDPDGPHVAVPKQHATVLLRCDRA